METKNSNLQIAETIEYDEFLTRFTFEKFSGFLKKNQGTTIEEICDYFKEEKDHIKFITAIWIKQWNTYFPDGRIIVSENKYFCMSPSNIKSRQINPQISTIF